MHELFCICTTIFVISNRKLISDLLFMFSFDFLEVICNK